MTPDFQVRSDSSFDPVSGISINRPRILPATLADGKEGTEYQYAFLRDGKRLDGLGFMGSDMVVERDAQRECVFKFHLGREKLLRAMLKFKVVFEADGDDFEFLCKLAQGLVLAYAGSTDNEDALRYVAATTLDVLSAAGVLISGETHVLDDGVVILAEVLVPQHAG